MSNHSVIPLDNAFFLTHIKWLVGLGGFFILFDWGLNDQVDLWLADQAYDHSTNSFPLKDIWFTAIFMHVWLKYFMVLVAVSCIGLLVHQIRSTQPFLSPTQIANLKIIASAALILPITIGTLKAMSPIHCPWDLARYGGYALDWSFGIDQAKGKCFPAGHVTSTSWLMAFTFIFLPFAKTKARWVWIATFGLAFFTGWIQQLRGAHFLCHTLWSLWISWAIIVGLAYYFRGTRIAKLHYLNAQ